MSWSLRGTVMIACNCDYGCPCNFNALPTHGFCEGGWAWAVDRGRRDELALDGLRFGLYCAWPGAIHEGGGKAVVFVDEEASDERREAVRELVSGDAGVGPWPVIGWTYELVEPVRPARFELELAGLGSRLTVGDALELELDVIRNPVTGAEVHPSMVLPEGLATHRADLGATKVFRLRGGLEYDHSGKYGAAGEFEYRSPDA